MPTSLYLHIPFCTHICHYCDFCKVLYHSSFSQNYLKALKDELQMRYRGEPLKTIYIGGGTPSSLSVEELREVFEMLKPLMKTKDCEYTIEFNIENTTLEKLKLCQEYGINRLSFGVETIHPKYISYLGRHHTKEEVEQVLKMANDLGFSNINVDLMYAFDGETVEEVLGDLDFLLTLPITHLSTYSLIIEKHTKLYLDRASSVSEEVDEAMYFAIIERLKAHQFSHYEISNFCKEGRQSRHNLVYWNNEPYYGIGLGASGYIGNVRYTNTRSFRSYFEGRYTLEEEHLTKEDQMSYEMILGLRKMKGVSLSSFFQKYGNSISEVFDYQRFLDWNYLIEEEDHLRIAESKLYLSNEVLQCFVGRK